MKLLILIHHPFALWSAPAWLGQRIRQDFSQIEVEQRSTYKNVEKYIREAEIFFGWSLRGDQFAAAKKLRWIHSTAAAVHLLMSPELRASNVVVTNARSIHGPVVGEHTIALMFAMAKRLPQAIRFQQQHVWAQEPIAYQEPHPTELAGSTVGIIGFGSIGSAVAARTRALGMRVLVVRQHPAKGAVPGVEIFGLERFDEVIPQCDFLVLAAPLTEQTRNIIETRRLALMKPTAYIVNVARGPLIDEAALTKALREHRIGGAALDVFDREPLSADSLFWDLDNVLITPHTAALTDRMWERHYVLIHENLRRYLAHEPLLGLVDKQAGY